MITAADLKTQTVKELGELAKQMGLAGWHSMRKDQLVTALVRSARKQAGPVARGSSSRRSGGRATAGRVAKGKLPNGAARSTVLRKGRSTTKKKSSGSKATGTTSTGRRTRKSSRIQRVHARRRMFKDLSTPGSSSEQVETRKTTPGNGKVRSVVKRKGASKTKRRAAQVKAGKDRIVLLVRDAYWLQACWEVTRQNVQRAKSAMAENWHTAKPVLRIYELMEGKSNRTAERISRDVEVHGGVTNWYIDVTDSPRTYRVDLGYLAANDKFYSLARSNTVTTPEPGSSDTIDENWTDATENYEKIYALSGGHDEGQATSELQELFEERLRRPMGSPLVTRYAGSGTRIHGGKRDFVFAVDAEMIIFGSTMPDAHVTLLGEPVKVRSDGTFTVRLSMPDKRQVIPVVASSKDGIEQRTIVVAVERNTKAMEPLIREADDQPHR
ncbi:MAG: DUF4912 domain-containing protein [Pirellulaceae bacterium]